VFRDIPEDLRALVEPVVGDHGCELVDVELRLGHGSGVVRVTVDSAVGDGRVPVERCAQISREIGTQLDAVNAIPGRYRLEVSSPGLDRVLTREKDFLAARGQEVKVETRRPLDGQRRFRGILIDFEDGVARIGISEGSDRREVVIPFEDVKKANTVYKFSRADFDRSANRVN
jgi:ribosome maturation factor RimP